MYNVALHKFLLLVLMLLQTLVTKTMAVWTVIETSEEGSGKLDKRRRESKI